MKHTFHVMGCPIPKARPRFGRGRTYTPAKTEAYELKVKLSAKAAGIRPIEGGVSLVVGIYVPDKRRRDRDNIEKAIQDALNGIAWVDDSQVCEWGGWLRLDRKNPRVEVTVGPASFSER